MPGLFKNPPVYYRVVPLWIWNARPDEEELVRQVRDMHSKGIGGFLVQSNPVPESGCSQTEWDHYIDVVSNAAKELGIRAYRYDGSLEYCGDGTHDNNKKDDLDPNIFGTHFLSPGLYDIKTLVSAAHLLRQRRVVAELTQYMNWPNTIKQTKHKIDYLAALGINFFCPSIIYYSQELRLNNCSALHSPYWTYYKVLADYAARLAYVLSQGTHCAQAALFQPSCIPGDDQNDLSITYFKVIVDLLVSQHVDFDIINECDLQKCTAIDQHLILYDEEYELLIIPPMSNFSQGTVDKVSEFIEDCGQVIALRLNENDGHYDTINIELNHILDFSQTFVKALEKSLKKNISITENNVECPYILSHHRKTDIDNFFFLCNIGSAPREVKISIRCTDAPSILNPETGESAAILNCTQIASRTIINHHFEPYESLLICFGSELPLSVASKKSENCRVIRLSNRWQFTTHNQNYLPLGNLTQSFDSGLNGEEKIKYFASFESTFSLNRISILIEQPEFQSNLSVKLNGCSPTHSKPWKENLAFYEYCFDNAVVQGENKIEIVANDASLSQNSVPLNVIIMGNFSVCDDLATLSPPREFIETGSWTNQGYPFYSGIATYKQEAAIPNFERHERVILQAIDPADVVEFIVNGASAGIRAWNPYEVEITGLVKPGKNTIELKIANTCENLIFNNCRPSGLIGGANILI